MQVKLSRVELEDVIAGLRTERGIASGEDQARYEYLSKLIARLEMHLLSFGG